MIENEIKQNHDNDIDQNLTKFTNQFLKRITDNLNTFSYNIIIANLYEMYSFLNKDIKKGYTAETIKENYNKILLAIMPIIPHFASECMEIHKFEGELSWPKFDKKYLIEDKINYVIQINGKKRGLIEKEPNITEENLLELIKKNDQINKYIEGNKFKKVIYIKNKLLNIII